MAFIGALALLAAVGACDRDPAASGEANEAARAHLTAPVRAMLRWQEDAFAATVDTPGAEAIRRFYTLRQDLRIPERRAAAEDTLWARLAVEPENFLWIEAGLIRRGYLSDPARLDSMLAVTEAAAPNGPVAAFIQARRGWGRIREATLGFFQAHEQEALLDPLQRIWLETRLVLVESNRGELHAAFARLQRTLPTAWEVGGLPLAACWWIEISNVCLRLGWLDDSVAAAQMAVECGRRDNNEIQEIRGRIAASAAHLARAEYGLAWSEALAGQRVAQAGGHLRWIQDLSRRFASILDSQGDRRAALAQYHELYEMALALADTPSAIGAALGQRNAYLDLGAPDSATTWLDRAAELNDAGRDHHMGDRIALLRWSGLLRQGRFEQADSLLTTIPEFLNVAGRRQVVFDLIELGFDRGLPDLTARGLAIARRDSSLVIADSGYDPARDLAVYSALLHAHLGEFAAAHQELARAEQLLARGGTDEARWSFAHYSGRIAELEGDDELAVRFAEQALDLAGPLNDARIRDRSRIHLGEVLIRRRDLARARSLFADSQTSPEYWSRLVALLMLGCVEAADQRHEQALRYYAAADSVLRDDAPVDLRTRLRLEEARSLAATGRPQLALARLDGVSVAATGGDGSLSAEVDRAFYRPLRTELAELAIGLRLEVEPDGPPTDLALETLVLAESARWQTDPTGALPAADDLRELPIVAGSPVVVYFVGPTRAFVWVGTDRGWTVAELGDRDGLLELVKSVQAGMRSPGGEADGTEARRLAQVLLGPVAAAWQTDHPLYVVAPGVLEGLPWPALPLPTADGRTLLADDRGPIIHLAALATASRLPADGPRSPARPPELLVVGQDTPGGGEALRYAEDEARAIAASWNGPTTLAVGDDARWLPLTARDLNRYAAIHVASHALVSEGTTGLPVLRLTGVEDEIPLTPEVVSRLDLAADLVFLSCCEGSRVRWDRGTGLDSFARAFLQAGARVVIASSCIVDDEAARRLALAFYAARASGGNPADALRQARREVRAAGGRWSHPFYWAFYQEHQAGLGPA
ncbi:MAG: CHAT domain-containing protein [Candidatus Krumholzibacteriia bacterium]